MSFSKTENIAPTTPCRTSSFRGKNLQRKPFCTQQLCLSQRRFCLFYFLAEPPFYTVFWIWAMDFTRPIQLHRLSPLVPMRASIGCLAVGRILTTAARMKSVICIRSLHGTWNCKYCRNQDFQFNQLCPPAKRAKNQGAVGMPDRARRSSESAIAQKKK